MSETVTVTTSDIHRVADKLEAGDDLGPQDMDVLGAVFYLAGVAAVGNDPEVSGFMPAYMRLGDIKGEASAQGNPVSLNFTKSAIGVGLGSSFNQGAHGGGGLGQMGSH